MISVTKTHPKPNNNNMETEPNAALTGATQETLPKIYSRKAIFGFSLLFAPIFGGVLLRQNLVDSNRKKEGNIVLLASIIFTFLTIFIVNMMATRNTSFTFLLNLVGGGILSEYFFKKYFPKEDYEYKKIWKPLLISILVVIPFILAMIYVPK
jgi:hypothetical protein